MNTTDTVLLVIITSFLSLFFLLACIAMFYVVRLLVSLKRSVKKAETVIDSVEAAADVFKDANGRMATLKLIKNVVDIVQQKKK